jgi:hypothetical protein
MSLGGGRLGTMVGNGGGLSACDEENCGNFTG